MIRIGLGHYGPALSTSRWRLRRHAQIFRFVSSPPRYRNVNRSAHKVANSAHGRSKPSGQRFDLLFALTISMGPRRQYFTLETRFVRAC